MDESINLIKKGQLLHVKAPPYYDKEYLYEVTSAGEKLVRANLYHSPKVKRSWTMEELKLLMEMGIIRRADEAGAAPSSPKSDG